MTVAATVSLLSSCQVSEPSFVRVEDGKFICDNTPSYFIGANFWYGAILGSEGQGVSEEMLALAEKTLKIPMEEKCESLNAAVAAAVVLWFFCSTREDTSLPERWPGL